MTDADLEEGLLPQLMSAPHLKTFGICCNYIPQVDRELLMTMAKDGFFKELEALGLETLDPALLGMDSVVMEELFWHLMVYSPRLEHSKAYLTYFPYITE